MDDDPYPPVRDALARQPIAVKDDAPERKHPFFFSEFLRVITGGKPSGTLSENFDELLEDHDPEAEIVRTEERAIFANMFRAGGLTLDDIMVPRADIVAVPEDAQEEELLAILTDSEHTRIPVYRESLDNITGFVHSKDLLRYVNPRRPCNIPELKRSILYSPPSARILDVLMRMRAERVHMCVVLDEYSATDGLVTMEDILEEIIGEIRDEHDDTIDDPDWAECQDGEYHISARVPLEDLERKTGIGIIRDEDEYDTVGGLVAHLAGKVPKQGDTIRHPEGLIFTITEADPRRIKRVKVRVG